MSDQNALKDIPPLTDCSWKSPEQTAVGAGRLVVASRRWLSFLRLAMRSCMKKQTLIPFITGVGVGAVFLSTAFAAGLVPAWSKASVTPVVLVTYDSLYGFRPVGSDSSLAPTWKKDQVTAVVETTYDSLWGFVPLKSNSEKGLGPSWKKEQVTPWAEVVFNSSGQFVTKNSD